MSFSFSPKIITDGLVLYLDAANPRSYISGSTSWNNISRGENNGTLTNGPTFSSTNGGSIVFDGIDDYVTLGDIFDDVIAGAGKQFTTHCEFYPTSTSNQIIYGKYADSSVSENGREFAVFVRDVGTGFKIDVAFSTNLSAGVNVVRSTNQLTLNAPNVITVTYDDTQSTSLQKVDTYINGVLSPKTIPSIGTLGPIAAGPAPFVLGGMVSSTGTSALEFTGNIYSLKLYNRLLTPQEILQNYNATKSRFGL